jgi:ABC-type antimicrobial peptide transport system permease subunit
VRNSGSDDQTTVAILNLVFSILTLVAMALCSFSLFASMSTNITEQSKEVGVLLALGLKPNHLVRVYALEAFVLVVSACFLGIGIGTFVAWSFGLQQYLFSGIPVPSIFPFAISLTILIASVVAAFFASAVPALELTKTSITTLLRS